MTEYHNPFPVAAAAINPEPGDINAILKDDKHFAGEAVDWVVSHFGDMIGCGDQGLYDYAVRPLAGDYARIKASGQAWADCGKMLQTVQTNLVRTSTQLVTSDWTGTAAKAFFSHVDVVFGAGMSAGPHSVDHHSKPALSIQDPDFWTDLGQPLARRELPRYEKSRHPTQTTRPRQRRPMTHSDTSTAAPPPRHTPLAASMPSNASFSSTRRRHHPMATRLPRRVRRHDPAPAPPQ